MSLLLLLACSDYGLEQKQDPPAPAEPDIDVSPSQISVAGFCTATEEDVLVTNVGHGTLTLSGVSVRGEGWMVADRPLPVELGAGESNVVILTATGGDATLVLESDDPDEPVVEVPLSGVANTPPVVSITSPVDGAIVPEGAALDVAGRVTDDFDAPDTLGVTWTGSVDGVLSTGLAGAGGATAFTWAPESRSTGPQSLTLAAADSCATIGSATISFCQDGTYTYYPLDLATWHYEGQALWDATDGWLQLTDNGQNEVGTAFETSTTVDASDVTIDFLFYIGGGTGADGISLTALDTTRMTTFLGGTGCGIGYGGDASCTAGPALPGWSIEVDTYYNAEADPTPEDHVAFTFDGDADGYRAWAALPEMEDTGWHEMAVHVVAPHVSVAIDGTTYIDQDIDGAWAFPAYVGFTAGTGSETNYHLVRGLAVTGHTCN